VSGPYRLFQSPCGVLGVCRSKEERRVFRCSKVSVPLRGFRGLQEAVGEGYRIFYTCDTFQSPCGVLGVCRERGHAHSPRRKPEAFQSPCGVLGVCRTSFKATRKSGIAAGVSVPLRGFRGLQAPMPNSAAHSWSSFQSPCGVLGVCRHGSRSRFPDRRGVFQSPCGVLGVCRVWGVVDINFGHMPFQSPCGVLGVCRKHHRGQGHGG